MKRTSAITNAAVAAALLLAGSLAFPAPALAAEDDVTWSVAPASEQGPDGRTRFEYAVDPGVTITDTVAITNFSATEQTFQLYAADGVNEFDGGEYSLRTKSETNTDLGVWTTLATTEVTLGPNQRSDVPFTIVVPANATPGDHSAGIVAAFTRTGTGEGQAVDVEQRVGSRIYLRVSGDIQSNLVASGLVAGYDSGFNPFSGDLDGHYTIQNNGNVRLPLEQVIRVSGPFGIPLGEFEGEAVPDLLPGQLVDIPVAIANIAPAFLLTVDATITTADAAGEPSAETATATTSATAWAVPWMILLALLLIAGLIVLVVWRRRVNRARMHAAIEQLRADGREQAAVEAASNEREHVGSRA
ncbi:WxL protein peptidoglycan domain-containing protein [Agromyces sp. Soil535]|uniref:WxL protein peptidoglycan domain-containing protein n=1 Tax=Agromyces sp. Soil535 TaxID=1736390 RepID=UPI0006FA570A|nr:DUF916 domain-containing protein [Agromyces sp. Soil535]KRE23021.1 hypothetical protein ASG80_09155 [Agromyces sp. Soil535]